MADIRPSLLQTPQVSMYSSPSTPISSYPIVMNSVLNNKEGLPVRGSQRDAARRPMHHDSVSAPLRVMIYDATCRTASFKLRGHKRQLPIGLSHSWRAGAVLYRGWGRLDHTAGFSDWATALAWLADVEPERPLGSIQFWGHGRWGHVLINKEPLSRTALSPNHVLHGHLKAIRDRLCGPEALWWFRTCETFGAEPGHHFARAWTDFMACQAAGHTFVIGPWQSGLHSLKPGETPHWSPSEGLQAGRPDAPLKAFMSGPRYPHTIHCLQGQVPPGW